MFSIRSIVALAIALSTFWIVGCTSTQTVPEATSGPVIDAAPVTLAAGDALGAELREYYIALIESELMYAAESTDDAPD